MADLLGFLRLFLRKKFPFRFIYSNEYWMVDIGKHVFPVKKYRLVYERLLAMGARKELFLSPEPARDEDLLLIHTAKYLKKLTTGTLSSSELQALELPFSQELEKFARLMVGGTILAASEALESGVAIHLGGGFHHAFPDHGEGFCMLNDVAVAAEKLRKERRIRKAMIIDGDVHQGNGTAAALAKSEHIFTFSIHQMDIYPSHKIPGSLDVGLWSGDGDRAYLGSIRTHIPSLYHKHRPDVVFYLAGADPFRKDQLGGLKLTFDGLKERDRIVIVEARKLRIPIVVLLAGGYASEIEDTIAIHLNTIKIAQGA